MEEGLQRGEEVPSPRAEQGACLSRLLLSSLVNAEWPLKFSVAGVQVPGQMWLLLGALETPGAGTLGWKLGSPHSALSCPGPGGWLLELLAGSLTFGVGR